MLGVTNAISKAGGECTVVHDAQKSNWFQTWKPKCLAAKGAVVIFSDAYRGCFSNALQQEAGVILEEYRNQRTELFVLNPVVHSAADLRACIQDGAAGMGDIDGWIKFVSPFLAAAAAGEDTLNIASIVPPSVRTVVRYQSSNYATLDQDFKIILSYKTEVEKFSTASGWHYCAVLLPY